jgi:hypothetical protein
MVVTLKSTLTSTFMTYDLRIAIYNFFNMNINQMKQSINVGCMQHFLYFESHKKSLKQLHIIVCFSEHLLIASFD